MLTKCLCLLLVFGALVRPVDAIDCYDCDGSEDKNCNDHFSKSVTIKSDCVQCEKWTGTYSGIEGPFSTRRCLTTELQAGLTDTRCTNQESGGVKGEVCWCNKNLCNGSETSAAASLAVAFPLLLLAGILLLLRVF